MKRATTEKYDARKRARGPCEPAGPDPQAESAWHQVLHSDARTLVLRNLDVVSLVAVSCASKRDNHGTRQLRGEYYVDGKRMPRIPRGTAWITVLKRWRVEHVWLRARTS
jgi:hypothetical protein